MSHPISTAAPRIGVVASTFPRPVDAYLLRELLAVIERGLDLRIYSLRHPGAVGLPRSASALEGVTVYAPSPTSAAVRAAHREFLRADARRYFGTLAGLARDHARSPRLVAKILAVWPQTVYFAHVARQDGVRHLHANWATYPAAAASAIGRLTGLPWSFAGHASDIYLELAGLPQKLRSAAFVTTCTAESRRYLLQVAGDVDPARVHTVYHGTDLAAFDTEHAEPRDFHMLAVGTLRHCKGFDTLLQVTARLTSEGVPARLTIVGDGEDRAALTRLASELGLDDRVSFTGYLPHEDVAQLYARASVLVLPARAATHFGIPNVIVEAQAASLPVVCTPLPALGELIEDGASGLFVPEDDTDRLVAALKALSADPRLRERLGSEGRKRVHARFDISKTAGALVQLFGGPEPDRGRLEATG
jgi:colanic acid/amylovoran biosynthesis glycosyltransferase